MSQPSTVDPMEPGVPEPDEATAKDAPAAEPATLWPPDAPPGVVVLFLLDARRDWELDLLRRRLEDEADGWPSSHRWQATVLRRGKRRGAKLPAELKSRIDEARVDAGDLWLQPLRWTWRSRDEAEAPLARTVREVMTLGASRRPGPLRGRRMARTAPERVEVLVGQGATLSSVLERWAATWGDEAPEDSAGAESLGPAEFVARQALVVLDRAERAALGARYKVPRLLPGDVFADPDYQRKLDEIAGQEGASRELVEMNARRYLWEMGAQQSPLTLDMMMALQRAAVRSHHDQQIDVREEQLAQVAELLRTRPVAFIMTHKSMLDSVALQVTLFDRNLPVPLTFGGINLNTIGIGSLARRAGVIFLRRAFQDNETYKATFRRYIDYLIEKRFSLLWALEGTRSRTGKLLPPRYGLFNYVVQAILRTRLYDVAFVPVNITYDQITEVEDYAIEQRGQEKKPEGAGWLLRFLQRGVPHGRIHLRFGDPVAVTDLMSTEQLDAGLEPQQQQTLVQTVAFETAVRMNQVTPITPTAIVTLILLASGARAQSLRAIQRPARAGMAVVRRRRIEVVGRTDFKNPGAVREALEQLEATGVVTFHDEGEERLYGIAEDQHIKAAYYRNTIVHYFVPDALVELALLQAAGHGEEAFWQELTRLRDLFKHEFYFRRRDEWRAYTERLLVQRYSGWREWIADADRVRDRFAQTNPLFAHAALRSFADAYLVAARRLARLEEESVEDRKAFVADCLRLGKQLLLEGRIFSAESVSRSLFETALKVADGRKLLDAGPALSERRRDFLDQLRDVQRRLDQVLAFRVEPED